MLTIIELLHTQSERLKVKCNHHTFSPFLVHCNNNKCLEGLDPAGQTHPCFFKCLYAKSSRLDNDIEAETLCFEHFLALRLLHLWPLWAPSCRLFIFLQKQSWTFVQFVQFVGRWFFSMCGKNKARGASSANRVFLMCLMHLLFALPPFYLLLQSAKTVLVQVLKGAGSTSSTKSLHV